MTIENWKIHKYIEIKQRTLEQTLDQRGKQKEFKKYIETNENENTIYQN